MADISEVQATLAALVAGVVYPTGTGNPSIVGNAIRIYPGAPQPAQLDTDLAAGILNISVLALPDGVNTTRYPMSEIELPATAPTLSIAVVPAGAGFTATLAGTVTTPQNVALFVNGTAYTYAVQAGDTLGAIATGVAQLVAANVPATSSGPIVTVPTAYSVMGRIGTGGGSLLEVGREQTSFMITVWAPTPALRDAVAKVLEPQLRATKRVLLPDLMTAHMSSIRSYPTDSGEAQSAYRRDSLFAIEFATVLATPTSQILAGTVTETPVNIIGGQAIAPTITTTF